MTAIPTVSGLRSRLVEAGVLFPTAADGVYGRSAAYQSVVEGIGRLVHQWAAGLGATTLHLPPVLARSVFDATDYMRSFPDLAGSVHVFSGGDRAHAELLRCLEGDGDWSSLLEPGEVVLAPAACHGLYPLCAGRLPEGGRFYEVTAWCFRHEPSRDPTRMQAFQMHEVVYLGDPADAEHHRDVGLTTAIAMLERLGLDVEAAPANDPFFGRLGAALAAGQRDEGLKFEGLTTLEAGEPPLAVLSANCHRDHFGVPFGIETAAGSVAHSACVGFGTDRIAIALLNRHGLDPSEWPSDVRAELSL
jgi:seryl-tRNA synthetase